MKMGVFAFWSFMRSLTRNLHPKTKKSPERSLGALDDVSRNLRGSGMNPVMVESGVPKGI